ncbi:MAG: hypothetical protein WC890_03120 [Candidatus Margulisiibacteriota bacterium]
MYKNNGLVFFSSFGFLFILLVLFGMGCGATTSTTTTSTATTSTETSTSSTSTTTETTTSTTTSTTSTSTSTTSTSTTTGMTTSTIAVGGLRWCYIMGEPWGLVPDGYHLVGVKAWLSEQHGSGTVVSTAENWDFCYSDGVTFEVIRVDGGAYRYPETDSAKLNELYINFYPSFSNSLETWPIDSTQAIAIFRNIPLVASWESGKTEPFLDVFRLSSPLTLGGDAIWQIIFDYNAQSEFARCEINASTGAVITVEVPWIP